jgi:ATP-dependent Lhr-like helicase
VRSSQPPSAQGQWTCRRRPGRGHERAGPADRRARRGRPGGATSRGRRSGRRRGAGARPGRGSTAATIVFANSRRLAERLTAGSTSCRLRAGGRDERPPGTPPRRSGAGRAGRRAPAASAGRSPPTTARCPRSSGRSSRRTLKSGRLPAVVATSSLELGHRHGRGRPRAPGRVAAVGRRGPAAHRPRRPPGRRGLEGRALPEVPRRPARVRGRRRADARGRDRGDCAYPRNPLDVLAQQIVAMVARAAAHVDELLALVRRAAPFADAAARALERARHARRGATRPTSSPSCGRGSCGTASPARSRARGPARSGWRSPAAARSPTAACSASSWSADGRPRRRARRGDGLRVAVGDVFLLGASSTGGSRTSPTTACSSRPRRAQPGADAVLEGRRPGRPAASSAGDRRVPRELGGSTRAGAAGRSRARYGLDEWARDNLLAYLREQRGGDRSPARRPHDRGRAVPRRARRLAAVRALALRRARARARGRWRWRPAARALRRRRRSDALRRRHRAAAARHRRRAPGADLSPSSTPTRSRTLVTAEVGGSALFAARFRECAARALLLPRATRASARRCGSSGSARAAARGRQRVRAFPIVLEAVPRVPAGRLRRARLVELMRDVRAARVRVVEVQTRRPRRSPVAAVRLRRRSSCTRATPAGRAPGRRRWRSTRLLPSCSAARAARAARSAGHRDHHAAAATPRLRPAGPRRRGHRGSAARAGPADRT